MRNIHILTNVYFGSKRVKIWFICIVLASHYPRLWIVIIHIHGFEKTEIHLHFAWPHNLVWTSVTQGENWKAIMLWHLPYVVVAVNTVTTVMGITPT